MSASPAPVLLPDAVGLWRSCIEGLSPDASPCRYLAPARWAALRESALDFLDRFGGEAHRLGWTAPELFGVHAEHGTLRLDHCGVLMINGRKVTGLEPTRILLGNQSAHRDRPGKVFGPPVWVFANDGARR